MKEEIIIEKMLTEHWDEVRKIYLEGIATGNATFQKEAPIWEVWNQSHLTDCRIIAHSHGQVTGWAALSPVSNRCVYTGVAEVSVYVSQAKVNSGVGSSLLKRLIELSEDCGIWTLQSGIFPENLPSLHLHLKHGFREVGRRERIGKMDGMWRDVVLVERRSEKTGI
jgi:L-amino acid N-acyltransferase YncA